MGGKISWYHRDRELPLHNMATDDLFLYYRYTCVYPPCCRIKLMGFTEENLAFGEMQASGMLIRYLELMGQICTM